VTPNPDILQSVEAAYQQHLAGPPARASVSFLGVEPIEVLRYPVVGSGAPGAPSPSTYLTLGMSRHAMADPAATVIDEASAPRAELMLTVADPAGRAWRQLAVLAASPAVEGRVYRPGDRIGLGTPWSVDSRCTGAVVSSSVIPPIETPGTAAVAVLAITPATQTELAWSRVHGTDALLQRWADEHTDVTDLTRDPVRLV
jgi:hypothetical protein